MDKIVVFCAQYLVAVAPLAVIACWFTQDSKMKRILFLRALVVGTMGIALAKIGGDLFHDTRPFVALHVRPLIDHVADNGFPSDHTLLAFGCSFLLWPFSRPLSIATGIVAIVVAWARVASLLHTPVDIAGSIVFAAVSALLAKVLIRRIERERHHPTGRVPGGPADKLKRKDSPAIKVF